jgi:DNA-binding CsgD family transcriptional regulator
LTGKVCWQGRYPLDDLPWRKVNDFVESIEPERSLEGFAGRVLQALEPLVAYDFAFCVVTSSSHITNTRLFLHRHTPPALLGDYFGHYISVDPAIPFIPSTSRGVVSWARNDTEFTRDFLRRHGTRHSLMLNNLGEMPEDGFVVVLHRSGRSGFGEVEKSVASALRPHLHNLFSRVMSSEKARRTDLLAGAAEGLTSRETEVLTLLCDRLSAREVAHQLAISRRTIEKHIENIYLKLRVRNRRALREVLLKRGLLDALDTPPI